MPSVPARRAAGRRRARRLKKVTLVVASLPLTQLFCYPNVIGALAFEAQNFINSIIFQWSDTVIRNLFRL